MREPPISTKGETPMMGAAYALGAFLIWGGFPVFFKLLDQVPALEVLGHRIVWSMVFMGLLLLFLGRWRAVGETLANRRLVLTLGLSALMISTNWLVFIWAVNEGRILETSLGYFISPLVSVVLGVVFLKESMRPWQWIAVFLAVIGVVILVAQAGQLPWVSLVLALSFAFYGLIRKVAKVDAFTGLFVETLIVAPLALVFLVYLVIDGSGSFTNLGLDGLLILSGVITALPLILYVQGAKRLRLSTIGLIMYITPTSHFALAVFVYGEPFTTAHLICFAFIWTGLAIYTFDASRALSD
ncbi:MAG: EamA family transporter RarD [Rhodospirillales bacterium]